MGFKKIEPEPFSDSKLGDPPPPKPAFIYDKESDSIKLNEILDSLNANNPGMNALIQRFITQEQKQGLGFRENQKLLVLVGYNSGLFIVVDKTQNKILYSENKDVTSEDAISNAQILFDGRVIVSRNNGVIEVVYGGDKTFNLEIYFNKDVTFSALGPIDSSKRYLPIVLKTGVKLENVKEGAPKSHDQFTIVIYDVLSSKVIGLLNLTSITEIHNLKSSIDFQFEWITNSYLEVMDSYGTKYGFKVPK